MNPGRPPRRVRENLMPSENRPARGGFFIDATIFRVSDEKPLAVHNSG
jgi:hypothetical protein